ncbi:trypsin-like peptidase domain-containing protein [Luteimonas sp. SMYT11W]|uniref:Trypsin-like peptidase domain-containing protein n=1 Tax=Luteimonas flava TaxID=3115822 RepID=A0ABU7WGW1_9GAMM
MGSRTEITDKPQSIHPLSRATTYIESYFFDPLSGEQRLRTYATGFFVRASTAILLVTNWHVMSGLDPSQPSMLGKTPPPHFLKIFVPTVSGGLSSLSLPLYDAEMAPRWEEHPDREAVDMAIFPLPLSLEQHFHFFDVPTAAGAHEIEEAVAKDVFVLGYPFSQDELRKSFGDGAPFFLPVWKRGSIATEPATRFNDRVILIDALSRPGMSGAPVLVAQDEPVLQSTSARNAEVFDAINRGGGNALEVLSRLDTASLRSSTVKRFSLLGVYSGVIGNTRLEQIALGKCWHVDTLRELTANSCPGAMPFHAPVANRFYDALLSEVSGGRLVVKNLEGEVVRNDPI